MKLSKATNFLLAVFGAVWSLPSALASANVASSPSFHSKSSPSGDGFFIPPPSSPSLAGHSHSVVTEDDLPNLQNTATVNIKQDIDTDDVYTEFEPLSCNADLELQSCKPWSVVFHRYEEDALTLALMDGKQRRYSRQLTIPCGECVYMDLQDETVILDEGIDIHGRLVLDEANLASSLTLHTPKLVVQGQLDMTSTRQVNGQAAIRIVLTGTNESQNFMPVYENAGACDSKDDSDDSLLSSLSTPSPCLIGKKVLVVAGGLAQWQGIPSNTPTFVNLYDVVLTNSDGVAVVTDLVVERSVLNGWSAGAEILITSHTNEWDNQHERTILGIYDDYQHDPNYVRLSLDAPLYHVPTSMRRDSVEFAVEVALLSRNIVIEGASGDGDSPNHGGHVWFMQTPHVQQKMVGVELRNMGQQGLLGRYPIHFHLCGNAQGAIVAKNTIRQSNQRCVVIHGTDNLLVTENIAYDTAGHCFMTEDGIETGNRFIRNLGALTRIPDMIIPDEGPNGSETDFNPATFWISHPSNVWVGNVAAGSAESGFWFEPEKRGPLKHLYDFEPNEMPLTLFRDNVAHSNQKMGIRSYPRKGIRPKGDAAHFTGLKLYRNREDGFFVHVCTNLVIEDSLFADNGLGLDLDRSDNILVRNVTIVGVSDSYRRQDQDQNMPGVCHRRSIIGLEMHTYGRREHERDGIALEDIRFEGFEGTGCRTSQAIRVDNNVHDRFWCYASYKDIFMSQVGGYKQIDFCPAANAGTVAHFLDLDGSMHPLSPFRGGPSTMVTTSESMLKFVDPNACIDVDGTCMTYCEETCFRSVEFHVSAAETQEHRLVVCKRGETNTKNCIYAAGYDSEESLLSNDHRVFTAHLPQGQYDAWFVNGLDEAAWPDYVTSVFQQSQLCPDSLSEDDIHLIAPEASTETCAELIRNGDMEASDTEPVYWLHDNKGVELLLSQGIGSSNALASEERDRRSVIVQYIDSRCMSSMLGHEYELSAYIKLLDREGKPYLCDYGYESCPEIGFRTDEMSYYAQVGVVEPFMDDDGFQHVYGIVRIDETLASAGHVRVYIRSNNREGLMVIDNVSMKLV